MLALQGDVALHLEALNSLGVKTVAVKTPRQLRGLSGLVIPGGESTSLLRLCEPIGMLEAVIKFARGGGALFGTCAGAILLAARVTDPAQKSLGLIDISIQRNGYGRQIDSIETAGEASRVLRKKSIPLVFIRAPRIIETASGVHILATYRDEPVLVRNANVLAATFHPELGDDDTVYRYWIDEIVERKHV